MTNSAPSNDAWLDTWLDAVASGKSTMSQRNLAAIESRGGGLARAEKSARAKGVHLLQLTDEHGQALVAASVHPFKVVC